MTESLFVKYEKELNEFQEWLSSKSHFPTNINKLLLLRFLKKNDFDLEKAKELLCLYLEMRNNNPNIFASRDVLGDSFQQALRTAQIFSMPQNTSDNHKITISRLIDSNPDRYVYLDVIRAVVAMMDVRLVTVDRNELIDGEISIIDVSGFGWKHFMKSANISVIKKYLKYAQEAAPFKVVQNHFINCTPTMERISTILKPFVKKEILDSIKFHTSTETLFEYVPKELIPNEYGGTAGKCEDIYKDWLKIVESKRDYILNDDNWKIYDV